MIVYTAMKVHLTKNKIKAPLAILLTHNNFLNISIKVTKPIIVIN